MIKVLGYNGFLMESQTVPDWHGLEEYCANLDALPDCVPTSVREWGKFKQEYETGVIAEFKKSPAECFIDFEPKLFLRFFSYGVDLLDFMAISVSRMIEDDLRKNNHIITIKTRNLITEYGRKLRNITDRSKFYEGISKDRLTAIRPDKIAMLTVLEITGEISYLLTYFLDPLFYGHKKTNFYKFIGLDKPVSGYYTFSDMLNDIKLSGKTPEEIIDWINANII